MRFKKKNQIMFAVIGITAVLIVTPMMITNVKKDNIDKKNLANHEINKNQVSKLQKSYIDIISEKTNGSKITQDSLKEIVPNVKLVEVDGYIPTGYNNIDKELRAIEFKENNEKVSITYSYNQGIQKDIMDIHYLDTNKKGYLNGIHAFYYLKDNELDAFETQIESVSVEDQEKLVNYIDNSSKEKETYKMYYKFAKMAQESSEFPKGEFDEIPDNMKSNISEKQTSIAMDGIILTFMHDENMKNIYGVKLIDKNGNILYTKSDIGNSMNMFNSDDNVSVSYIVSESLEEQEKLLTKLNQNIQESTPRKTKDIENNYNEEDNTDVENKMAGMSLMNHISYSSELNSKYLTMKDSIEYVKSNTREDIKEVERTYIDDVGVTEVTYKSDKKKYIVRYMHPYKVDKAGNESSEYDLNETVGIWVYENYQETVIHSK